MKNVIYLLPWHSWDKSAKAILKNCKLFMGAYIITINSFGKSLLK